MEGLEDVPRLLIMASLGLLWIGMLGLLWRRSLVGMLVGLFLGWISAVLAALGMTGLRGQSIEVAEAGVFGLLVAVVGCLQVAVGLAIVVARIKRRGSLDADDAGLLEG